MGTIVPVGPTRYRPYIHTGGGDNIVVAYYRGLMFFTVAEVEKGNKPNFTASPSWVRRFRQKLRVVPGCPN